MGTVLLAVLLQDTSALGASALSVGSLLVRAWRDGRPAADVALETEGREAVASTDAQGLALLSGIAPGLQRLTIGGREVAVRVVSGETTLVELDLADPGLHSEPRLGRTSLSRAELRRFAHGGTVGALLETLDPWAVTDRIDVAGIESASPARWSVRGSSWTQNRVLLDGLDVSAPEGGRALLHADVEGLQEVSLSSALTGAQDAGPGATLRLVTVAPPRAFAGSALLRYTGGGLQGDNRSASLLQKGVEPRELVRFPSGRIELGGRELHVAVQAYELASRLPRYPDEVTSRLLSGTAKARRGRFSVLGLAQGLDHDGYGARPGAARETTVEATESFQVGQAHFGGASWEAAFGLARGSLDAPAELGLSPIVDLATGERRAAPLRSQSSRSLRLSLSAARETRLGRHLVRSGVEWSRGTLERDERVPGGLHRLTVDAAPHAVALFMDEPRAELRSESFGAYAHGIVLAGRLSLRPGLRFDHSRSPPLSSFTPGRTLRVAPGSAGGTAGPDTDPAPRPPGPLRWTSLAPSMSLSLPIGASKATELHASWARYDHLLTTRLVGATAGASSVWRRWTDVNRDGQVQPLEMGGVLRREGPAFTTLDPDLPRPFTDEIATGIERRFSFGVVRLMGYHRWEKRLPALENVGARPDDYARSVLRDVGKDGKPGTPDDGDVPIFDRRLRLGDDSFRVTHPAGLDAFSQGLDLTLAYRRGPVSATFSGRAYRDVGSPPAGNTVDENDTGVLPVYVDPNSSTNARGRLNSDRAYTARILASADLPWGLELGAAVRYWDGYPFTRYLFFPSLGQGFTRVQAFPRGTLRHTYNLTVDVRTQKRLRLSGKSLSLAVDVFNLLDQPLETEENWRSGSDFRRTSAVQPARTLRFEARLEF